MPIPNLSKEDLKLVKRFQSCVSRRKRMPDALYKKITLSTTLPKSIKALAKRYQTLVQSGGTGEGCWTYDNKNHADLCTLPLPSKDRSMNVLGEGANGIVFNYLNEPNYVWKQSNEVSEVDRYIEQLKENFIALNSGLEDPIYISLFKALPNRVRTTLNQRAEELKGFAYKMKKFKPFVETDKLIDNIKALCRAVDRHHSTETELVHFDAKLDNVLVDEESNCTLVDVDGSLSFSKITEVSFLQKRSKFHAITPLFAHPLILAIFHGTDELLTQESKVFWEEITWLLNICMVDMRNSEILNIIDHHEFHKGVFQNDDILSLLREKPLLNLLRYADYYSLLLSYYMYVVMKINRQIEKLEDKVAKEKNAEVKKNLEQNKKNAKSYLGKIKICFINALKSKAQACRLIDLPPAAKGGFCKGTKRPRTTQPVGANNAQTMESRAKYPRTTQPVGVNNAQTMKLHLQYWNKTTLNALQQIPKSDIEYVTIGLDCKVYVKPDPPCENPLVSEDEEVLYTVTFPYTDDFLKQTE